METLYYVTNRNEMKRVYGDVLCRVQHNGCVRCACIRDGGMYSIYKVDENVCGRVKEFLLLISVGRVEGNSFI